MHLNVTVEQKLFLICCHSDDFLASFSVDVICLVDINEPTSCVTSMRVHACACVCDADAAGWGCERCDAEPFAHL